MLLYITSPKTEVTNHFQHNMHFLIRTIYVEFQTSTTIIPVACLAQEHVGLNRNLFHSNKCTGSVMYSYSKRSILKDWLYTLTY